MQTSVLLGITEVGYNTVISSTMAKEFGQRVGAFTVFKEFQNIFTAVVSILVINLDLGVFHIVLMISSVFFYLFTFM